MSRLTRWTFSLFSIALGVAMAAYLATATPASNAKVEPTRSAAAEAKATEQAAGSHTPPGLGSMAISTHWSPIAERLYDRLERQVTIQSDAPSETADSSNDEADNSRPKATETKAAPELPRFTVSDDKPDAPTSAELPSAELPAATPAATPAVAEPARPADEAAPLPATAPAPATSNPPTAEAEPQPPATIEPLPEPGKIGISPAPGEGDDQLRVYIKDEDIRVVLAALSEQGGLNILPSKNVQGTVSASLNGVSVDTALEAILRSTGFVARREGQFVYVGTPQDFQAMAHVVDHIGTRIYRPNYVTSSELVALITPILTPQIGKAVPSSPSKVDIPADDVKAGGNDFAGADAVLVQDYEAVLAAVDQIVDEIDKRPAQVAIEAMILSVRLDDSNQFGVDFQFLKDKNHLRLGSGEPMTDVAQVTFNNGLKFAFLDSSLGTFLTALESVGDTNVVATPRLMVLNKHKAEILIGSELGYVSTSQTETSTTQSVNFLEVGAQLRLRPFISHDGMIRMEIHPELSTGTVRVEGGFTLPDKDVTKVTTNIMVRDGYTVVIGGLMREDLTTTTNQIPLVGNLPVVGPLFRNKTEDIEKREILVLVTPHIMQEPGMYKEGEQGAGEFHRRQASYQDKMSPLGKRSLGRKYFRLAQEAWARGESTSALRLISLSIQFDPMNRAAIDLRSDIQAGRHSGDHSGGLDPHAAVLSPEALDGQHISPLLLEQLEQPEPIMGPPPAVGPPVAGPPVPAPPVPAPPTFARPREFPGSAP